MKLPWKIISITAALTILILAIIYSIAQPAIQTSMSSNGFGLSSYYYDDDDFGFYKTKELAEMADVAEEAFSRIAPVPTDDYIGGETAAETEQKMIKTGDLSVVVDDATAGATQVSELASKYGGYVQSLNVYEYEDGSHYAYVTIRVPIDNFDSVMTDVKTLANLVETESIDSQDVTEQYTDLEARLKNAEAEEAQYLAILEKAEDVEDILNVTTYLSRVRETIERYEAQIKYLENQTDLATIYVYLGEEERIIIPADKWQPWVEIKTAVQTLVVFFQQVANALIWIVIFSLGVALPLALIIWLTAAIVRRIMKKRTRKQ